MSAVIEKVRKMLGSRKEPSLDELHEAITAARAERAGALGELNDLKRLWSHHLLTADDAEVERLTARRRELEEVIIPRAQGAIAALEPRLAHAQRAEEAAGAAEAAEALPDAVQTYDDARRALQAAQSTITAAASRYEIGYRASGGTVPRLDPYLRARVEQVLGRELAVPKQARGAEDAPRVTPTGIVYPDSWTPERIKEFERSEMGRKHKVAAQQTNDRRAAREREEAALAEARETRVQKRQAMTGVEAKKAEVERRMFPSLHGED